MTGEMLASFLQGLPSNTIERVEVMPNPSARYEPDGMSGILNIVLKKDVDRGLNGAVTAGTGTQDNANFSGMLGYGKGPLNAMVNYGFRYGTRTSYGTRYNEYRFGEAAEYLNVLNTGDRNSVSHNLNLNVDYRLSRYNALSLTSMVGTRGQDGDDLNAFSEHDAASVLTNRYDRYTDLGSDGLNTRAGLAFKRVLEAGKHEFTAEVDYGFRNQQNDQTYRQERVMPGTAALQTELEQTDRSEDNSNASAQVDYVRPLGSDGKLEAGAKSTLRQLDSDYFSETYDETTGAFVADVHLNNAFVYDEQVHAAYVSAGQQLGPVGVQLGLRAEQAMTTFDLTTTGEAYDNSYFRSLPVCSRTWPRPPSW
jgi:hypothetical protein